MSPDHSYTRCPWAEKDPLYVTYHDTEWGVPVHNDRTLFEFLILESFQAGLSWLTVLRKRENFRRAFAGFDPVRIARFTEKDRERLLLDAGIIRNRQKIDAAINNASVFLKLQEDFGSFDRYVWQFTEGRTIVNHWNKLSDLPAKTNLSDAMSKDMGKRGFKFRGSTICYAFMQATGMVNDHLVTCFRYQEVNHDERKAR